eukprot:CAMPEP_0174234416 /NCGR_PEP_ID=MMETSP0417-20130205/4178_1 /TAXON_ID=242541 /ORGANISM="Mayorella sp, Strain BSH-02190019" /LENGTH=291 /DNA_ID=CAMNT_0015312777 /DNA_START=141 /DNA_END=1016 /DNA_ORIENTATION=-
MQDPLEEQRSRHAVVEQQSAAQVQALVEDAAELATLHQELQRQVRDEEQIQAQLKEKQDFLVPMAESLEAKLLEEQEQFKEAERRRAESREQASARVRELEALVAVTQADWQAAMKANDALDGECAALEKRLEDIKAELDHLELLKQLEELEERLATLQEALMDEKTQTEDLTLVRDELQAKVKSLAECLPNDEGARARIQAKIDQLQERIRQAEAPLGAAVAVTSSSWSAEAELATVKSELQSALRELEALRRSHVSASSDSSPSSSSSSWLTTAAMFTLAAVLISRFFF